MFARMPLKTAFGAAALAAAGLMLTPAAASAQAYGYQGAPQTYGSHGSYGYDQSRYGSDPYGQSYDRSGYRSCENDRRQRQGTGVAVGATLGAVVGSQLGARGRRTEGSVLGAVIGGALGAAVSSDSSRGCNGGQAQYGYDDRNYGGHSQYAHSQYGQSQYGQSQYGYSQYGYDNRGYDDRGYSNQGGQYGYDDRDNRNYGYQANDRYRSDCRTVTVRSRDAYGRTVTRYQQSC